METCWLIQILLFLTLKMRCSVVYGTDDFTNMTTAIPADLDFSSCKYRCDDGYVPALPCYCNDACNQYENCCYDFYELCRPELIWSDEWLIFEGHVYKYFAEPGITSSEAGVACEGMGTRLLSINSEDENQFVGQSVLKKRTLSAYIGGSDREQEGVWRWLDGSLMPLPEDSWHGWHEGEPNNERGEENCAVLTNYAYWREIKFKLESYKWRDYQCDLNLAQQIQGYVCEGTVACESNPCLNNGTCQYHGVDKEYVCKCQDNFLGDHCQYEVVAGQTWSECGETSLTGTRGVIISPLYPDNYPNNVECEWVIEVHQDSTVALSIDDFLLEEGKGCAFDRVAIYDGSSANGTILLDASCGSLANLEQTDIQSRTNKVVVTFTSDSTVRRPGFQLSYSVQNCGGGSGDSGCGTQQTFTSECGEMEVKHGPSDHHLPCEWLIDVGPDNLVNLTFTAFSLLYSGSDCSSGHLTVYNGPNEDYPRVGGRYCGERFPWSVQSTDRHLYIQLRGQVYEDMKSQVKMEYTALRKADFEQWKPVEVFDVSHGDTLVSADWPVNVRHHNTSTYKWLVRAEPGQLIGIQYEAYFGQVITIFEGVSDLSTIAHHQVLDGSEYESSVVNISRHQTLVVVSFTDSRFSFTIQVSTQDWLPSLSGCYRPMYFDNDSEPATENSAVSPLNPVVIMASDETENGQPTYHEGLYCKWHIQSDNGQSLDIDILDMHLFPIAEDCIYDGFVVLQILSSGQKLQYGPFCGNAKFLPAFEPSASELIVVFYSDTRKSLRNNGEFRTIVTAVDPQASYDIHEVSEESVVLVSSQGSLLSPGFPKPVTPGQYFWTVESGVVDTHFNIYLYYVRGPALEGDCSQTFKIIEISRDSGILRQSEEDMLSLCADVDLFIPNKWLKTPPNQKFAVELNTASASLPQTWQFKLSYDTDVLEPPGQITSNNPELCEGEDYLHFQGRCYRYLPWILRHYQEEEYSFQQTWHNSQQYCEQNNATLIKVHDLTTARFVKYMLSHAWFWDPASPHQSNNRIIFIGLSNKKGWYEWMDGTRLSFADWYVPYEEWEQSLLQDETMGNDFISPENPQPAADDVLLCTAMMPVSPFGSLNWVKVPCDYPMFVSGLICEKPDKNNTEDTDMTVTKSPSKFAQERYGEAYEVCEDGFFMFKGRCLQMYTNYTLVEGHYHSKMEKSEESMWYIPLEDAKNICSNIGGSVAQMGEYDVGHLVTYLDIWQHDISLGDIWLRSLTNDTCQIIEVTRDTLSTKHHFNWRTVHCEAVYNARSVLCEVSTIGELEECGEQEFECDNMMCVTTDSRCDNHNDCGDMSDERGCDCGDNMFSCDNGQCVPMSLYCDYTDHCGDNSDETGCIAQPCSSEQFTCDSGQCIDLQSVCDFTLDCADHSDEKSMLCDKQCNGIQCFSGKCIHSRLAKDLVPDCPGFALEDERDTIIHHATFLDVFVTSDGEEITNKSFSSGCSESGAFSQCREGSAHCYRRERLCVYDTVVVDESDQTHVQDSCRDGTHLRTDCGEVEQPGLYQCGTGYYIPVRKLCDGVRDCSEGEDEHHCQEYVCPGLFKCKGESYCIAHSEVCDGTVQCMLHREDEKYCEIPDELCSNQCECDGFTVSCQHRDSHHNMTDFTQGGHTIPVTTRSLNLRHAKVKLDSSSFRNLHFLGKLLLSHNNLDNLPVGVFRDLHNLFELDLSFNQLASINQGVFEGLTSLHLLDLSHNSLRDVTRDSLYGLSVLSHLVLTTNPLDTMAEDALADLSSLSQINTDKYKFCCVATGVDVCTPEADEFSSCEDLMANTTLQVFIWVLGIMAFIGNVFVVVWRLKKDRSKVASFFIINLGLSDFLMGVYLLIIASVDVYYRGDYIMYADRWQNSGLCQFAGILATLSSEVSVYMLTAITADRIISILFPLKLGKMRLFHARIITAVGWVVCFFLSILPITGITYFGDAFYGRTGVCLPFHLSDERLPGWEYSVSIFLIANFLSFMVILVAYIAIFVKVKYSIKNMGKSSTANTDEYTLAKKLMAIVATDFACWVPIIIVGFAALSGSYIPPQVSAWIAVFFLPLNSSLNPLLYTISSLEFSRKRKKNMASSKGATVTSNINSNP